MERIYFWVFKLFNFIGHATDTWDHLQIWLINSRKYYVANKTISNTLVTLFRKYNEK